MTLAFELRFVDHPGYLHATAVGPRTPENAYRFLADTYQEVLKRGYSAVLLEMALTGPSLDLGSIFRIISERSADGRALAKVAYVDPNANPQRAAFAETVGLNRGVNVRLFRDVESATTWLTAAT
jgi:hypothetical protein